MTTDVLNAPNSAPWARNGLLSAPISVECTSYGTPATAGTVRGRGRLVRSRHDQPYLRMPPRSRGDSLMPGNKPCLPGCKCGKHRDGTSLSPDERLARRREQDRARFPARQESNRAASRRWREANPERVSENNRAYRSANKGKLDAKRREWLAANPDYKRDSERRLAHGLRADQFAEMWTSQGGRCYLCGDDLPREPRKAHIDHDHACCPPGRSCGYCRRGIACSNCNLIIGLAFDDPDRLERIAASLRPAAASARVRIADKPVQDELPIGVTQLNCREDAAG